MSIQRYFFFKDTFCYCFDRTRNCATLASSRIYISKWFFFYPKNHFTNLKKNGLLITMSNEKRQYARQYQYSHNLSFMVIRQKSVIMIIRTSRFFPNLSALEDLLLFMQRTGRIRQQYTQSKSLSAIERCVTDNGFYITYILFTNNFSLGLFNAPGRWSSEYYSIARSYEIRLR